MPSINLLPWREERRKSRQQTFNMRLVLSAFVGIFVLLLMWFGFNAAISNQQARNNYLKGQIALLDKQIAEIKNLQQIKNRLLARMKIIEQLQQSRPTEVHLFDQLLKTLPPGVYLTEVRQKGAQVEIHGVAESSARVSTYMRNIDSSDWMGDPNLEVVQKDPKVKFGARAQQFNVTAKVVDKAEAAKNSKTGGTKS